LGVNEPLDLIGIDAEIILSTDMIEASFQAKGFGQCRESSESGRRNDHVRTGLGGQPHQNDECLRGTSHNLHGLKRNLLHFSNRLTQTVDTGGAAVNQVVVQKVVACFVVRESENFVYSPDWPRARGKVEFYVVFVLVEPGVEQERLELHVSTFKVSLPIIDP